MITENLQVSLSENTVLVPTDVVRAVLGVDSAAVSGKVDTGELQWVFDLSKDKSGMRELRFWVRELQSPECGQMASGQALGRILGERQRWCGPQIQQLLMISGPSISRWHQSGELPGEKVDRMFWTTRAALEQFLSARLCNRDCN